METQEDIATMLDAVGESLVFTGVTIKGIPKQEVYNVQNFDSPYDVEKQDFTFQISATSFYANSLDGTSFTYTHPLNPKKFTFKIISFIDDLTGWVELKVKLTGKANV